METSWNFVSLKKSEPCIPCSNRSTSPYRDPSPRTCSNLGLTVQDTPSADIWWILKDILLSSGWYASYWNAFLLESLKLYVLLL